MLTEANVLGLVPDLRTTLYRHDKSGQLPRWNVCQPEPQDVVCRRSCIAWQRRCRRTRSEPGAGQRWSASVGRLSPLSRRVDNELFPVATWLNRQPHGRRAIWRCRIAGVATAVRLSSIERLIEHRPHRLRLGDLPAWVAGEALAKLAPGRTGARPMTSRHFMSASEGGSRGAGRYAAAVERGESVLVWQAQAQSLPCETSRHPLASRAACSAAGHGTARERIARNLAGLFMADAAMNRVVRPGRLPRRRRSPQRQAPALKGEGRSPLAVQTSPSARLNNYFFIVWPNQHDLATEAIRQRMRKSVYPVSLVPQIG